MKYYILLLFVALKLPLFGQDLKTLQEKLNHLSDQRLKWSRSQTEKSYDSLEKYNQELEDLILNFSSKNPKTLSYKFDDSRAGLNIVTSADGLFRIYTWNTFEGGTMQVYNNLYQYKVGGKVYAVLGTEQAGTSGCLFYENNEVMAAGKRYYLTSSIRVGSTALYYYEAKIFAIEGEKLNTNVKLIKTKTGIRNTLGYEVDLSSSSNRNRKDGIEPTEYIKLTFDKKNNTIVIPLIEADGKVTKGKIKYQLRDKYFEKI